MRPSEWLPDGLQQAGGGEDEGAGAHRGGATCIGCEPTHVMKQLLIQDRGVHARTAGHDQRVHGTDDVAGRGGGELQATAGHHRTSTSGDDLRAVRRRIDEPRGGGEDLQRSGDVEDLRGVEGHDDDPRRTHRRSIRSP